MIKVSVQKKNNTYKQISLKGHALFATYGSDIVCAGVSALVINTVNSIDAFCSDEISVTQDEDAGELLLELPDQVTEQCNLLLDSLCLGLSQIAQKYSNNVNYNIQEVEPC